VPAFLLVGASRIRLGLDTTYEDSILAVLPRPKPQIGHDGDRLYCYSFDGGYLTAGATDFGSYIDILTEKPKDFPECLPIAAAPRLELAGVVMGLDIPRESVAFTKLQSFTLAGGSESDSVYTRRWKFMEGRYCTDATVSLGYSLRGSKFDAIRLGYMAEAGEVKEIVRPGTQDTVRVCS
jgi:hypothetical protein